MRQTQRAASVAQNWPVDQSLGRAFRRHGRSTHSTVHRAARMAESFNEELRGAETRRASRFESGAMECDQADPEAQPLLCHHSRCDPRLCRLLQAQPCRHDRLLRARLLHVAELCALRLRRLLGLRAHDKDLADLPCVCNEPCLQYRGMHYLSYLCRVLPSAFPVQWKRQYVHCADQHLPASPIELHLLPRDDSLEHGSDQVCRGAHQEDAGLVKEHKTFGPHA